LKEEPVKSHPAAAVQLYS